MVKLIEGGLRGDILVDSIVVHDILTYLYNSTPNEKPFKFYMQDLPFHITLNIEHMDTAVQIVNDMDKVLNLKIVLVWFTKEGGIAEFIVTNGFDFLTAWNNDRDWWVMKSINEKWTRFNAFPFINDLFWYEHYIVKGETFVQTGSFVYQV